MKRLLLLLCLVLHPLDAGAAELLRDCFGVPLGAPCAVCEDGEVLPEAVEGLATYRVLPPRPDPRFELYQVRVDEKRGGVVDVAGVALSEREAPLRNAFETLRREYEARLGKPEFKELRRAESCVFTPKGSQRVLMLLLREDLLEGRWVLYLNAMDRKAFAKARKKDKAR